MKCNSLFTPPQITSIVDLENVRQIFEQYRMDYGGSIIPAYRGQGRSTYRLIPSFYRGVVHQNPAQSEKKMQDELVRNLKQNDLGHLLLTEQLMQDYRKEWNLPSQLQHLGLPTRMLDWSLGIEQGLYFAVEDEKDWDDNGQLWCLFPREPFTSKALNDNYFDIGCTYFVNISGFLYKDMGCQIGENNRFNQSGVFTVQPYELACNPIEEQGTSIGILKKYEIPKESKKNLKNALEKRGIHERSIYEPRIPELDNIVKIIKEKFGYEIRSRVTSES